MRSRARLSVLMMCCVLTASVAIGLPASSAPKKPVIALAAFSTMNDQQIQTIQGFKETVEKLGGQSVVADAMVDQNKHYNNVENFIQQKVDALLVLYGFSERLEPYFKKASEAGIPVITIDVSLHVPYSLCDVTTDNFLMGVTLARRMFADIGYQGKIIQVWSPRSAMGLIRKNMLEAMAKTYPKVSFQEVTIEAADVVPKSMAAMESILMANPQKGSIAAVWAHCDQMGIGPWQAIERAGRKEIKVYSIDGDSQAFHAVRKGGYGAIVAQSPYQMAKKAVEFAFMALEGKEKNIPSQYFTPFYLVGPENVVEMAELRYGKGCWEKWGWK